MAIDRWDAESELKFKRFLDSLGETDIEKMKRYSAAMEGVTKSFTDVINSANNRTVKEFLDLVRDTDIGNLERISSALKSLEQARANKEKEESNKEHYRRDRIIVQRISKKWLLLTIFMMFVFTPFTWGLVQILSLTKERMIIGIFALIGSLGFFAWLSVKGFNRLSEKDSEEVTIEND